MHRMDAQMEKQVIGRAQRFGRKGALRVCHMEFANEFDNAVQGRRS
jgi:hypothetical protein